MRAAIDDTSPAAPGRAALVGDPRNRPEGEDRPSVLLLAAELPRAAAELAAMVAVRPLLAPAPRGDGHPVLVLPGFTAGDRSTWFLRSFLRRKGYVVNGWSLGPNLGPTRRIVRGLEDLVGGISDLHGRTCSLVGWSLGGVFAREIARKDPHLVRQVVTLGTPLRLNDLGQLNASPLYRALSFAHDADAISAAHLMETPAPLSVPATSIYSRTDGLAPWQICQDGQGPQHESIEVLGSHSGMAHNPAVLAVLADRLAQPEGQWSPFTGSRLSRCLGTRP